jgi:[CysO sulfur-carrier protein]-S-L-cysteine hydrolase
MTGPLATWNPTPAAAGPIPEDRPPRPLEVPADILDAMLAHCRQEAPLEACGFLAGHPPRVCAIYTMHNALASPTRYMADEHDLSRGYQYLRTRRLEILALYHSHPASSPVPSRTDLEQNYYGGVPRIIVSLRAESPEVGVWQLGPDSYEEVPWTVIPAGA